jgi:DNA-binding transcriptional ArsR family regulator
MAALSKRKSLTNLLNMSGTALDRVFAALADPTRRAIVMRLAEGETTVSELAKPFSVSLPAISRHLRVLEAARLIRQERAGQFRRCKLDIEGMTTAAEWLAFYRRFWSESFQRLDEHLDKSLKPKGKPHGKSRKSGR